MFHISETLKFFFKQISILISIYYSFFPIYSFLNYYFSLLLFLNVIYIFITLSIFNIIILKLLTNCPDTFIFSRCVLPITEFFLFALLAFWLSYGLEFVFRLISSGIYFLSVPLCLSHCNVPPYFEVVSTHTPRFQFTRSLMGTMSHVSTESVSAVRLCLGLPAS